MIKINFIHLLKQINLKNMKLADIFKKKSASDKTKKVIIKVDQKQLEKIVGGATTSFVIKQGCVSDK
jgi:hypothetical protein